MALPWNDFLPDDPLNSQNDRWDLPSRPSSQPTQTAATSTAPATSNSISPSRSHASPPPAVQAPDFSQFNNALPTQDMYFSDAFYNDPNNYFLADLEVLEPLGNVTLAGSTSHSSPENYNDVSQADPTDPSRMPSFEPVRSSTVSNPPMTSTAPSASSSRNQPETPSPSTASLADIQQLYAKAFPSDPRSQAYVDDVTYLESSRQSSTQVVNTLETVDENRPTDLTTSKRNRGGVNNNADSISACWTSPLCPNHKKDGTPPNPSTCNGGCAPFLFADEAPLFDPNGASMLGAEPLPSEDSPKGVVEIQSRTKSKRSESDSNCEAPSGRVFSKSGSAATDFEPQQQSHLKNENSPESHSPEDTTNIQPTTEGENKNKGRRRLPHNQVERKYRESLNTQLESLRRVVPALQQSSRGCDGGDIEDLPTPSKPSKAVVLASATAYIKQMEKDKKQLADENQLLRSRIKALQALVKCEDCSLMQYVMDLKLRNGAPGG